MLASSPIYFSLRQHVGAQGSYLGGASNGDTPGQNRLCVLTLRDHQNKGGQRGAEAKPHRKWVSCRRLGTWSRIRASACRSQTWPPNCLFLCKVLPMLQFGGSSHKTTLMTQKRSRSRAPVGRIPGPSNLSLLPAANSGIPQAWNTLLPLLQ